MYIHAITPDASLRELLTAVAIDREGPPIIFLQRMDSVPSPVPHNDLQIVYVVADVTWWHRMIDELRQSGSGFTREIDDGNFHRFVNFHWDVHSTESMIGFHVAERCPGNHKISWPRTLATRPAAAA